MSVPTSMGHSWLCALSEPHSGELRDSARADFAMQIRKPLQPIPLHPAAPGQVSTGRGVQLPTGGPWSYLASLCFAKHLLPP